MAWLNARGMKYGLIGFVINHKETTLLSSPIDKQFPFLLGK